MGYLITDLDSGIISAIFGHFFHIRSKITMIVRPKFFRPAEEKLPPSLTNPQELREFSDEAYEKFYEKISEARRRF